MIELDAMDKTILKLLSEDSRRSYREIAKELGVSHANVSARIRRLEDARVIRGYTTVLDPETLNLYPLCIRISAGPGADLSSIEREVARLERSNVVLRVSGDCELLVLAMCEDRQEALELLNEVSGIHGVDKAESHVVLEAVKISGKNMRE
ncbi:MAG: Lrp/AsnC family transcriptional regulator [Candidatus Bathyarchaeota archaeon]|nr:MAG: Lrp/AsnC family transcriptional regulator [Candidatus Bathyarchaeota archaeon]